MGSRSFESAFFAFVRYALVAALRASAYLVAAAFGALEERVAVTEKPYAT